MEEKELLQYRDLIDEIGDLKKRIQDMEEPSIQSPQIDGMPRGYQNGDPQSAHVLAKERLIEQLQKNLNMMTMKLMQVELAIESLQDPVDRRIARLRYIEGLYWYQIALQIGFSEAQIYRKRQSILEELKDESS